MAPYNPGVRPPPWGGPPMPWNGRPAGPAWGGGKGKGPSWQQCSKDGYFESKLRPEDCESYSSTGLLMYRKGEKGVEILLAVEKPWNPLVNDYDPLAWNPILGKKAGGPCKEWDSAVTAARCTLEVIGGCEGAPSTESLEKMCRSSPVVWYPNGKFALYIHEYSSDDGDIFPDAVARFAEAKVKGLYPHTPEEEGRVNSKGQPMTKWVKQIEELAWVSASDLMQETPPTPLTDLMKNLLKIAPFSEFMSGGVPPPPPAPTPVVEGSNEGAKSKGGKNSKGGGKSKDGKKGGGSKGKKGKGDNMKGGDGKGKGMPYAFMPPPPPMNPQMYPIEMQRQMLGEKLYMLVQPLVPTPVVAQKVTGMLLELPMPELMPLLGPAPEERSLLKQRVEEAMEVLASDEAGM